MPLHPSAEAILPMFKDLLQITPDSDPAVVRATMEAAIAEGFGLTAVVEYWPDETRR